MDLMKNISTLSTSNEENTKLLFFESYKNEKSIYNIEEIFFGKAIHLHQIRILKSDSNPHPKIKSIQSITQTAPIYNFEIFARNLKKYGDKFECIFESSTINEKGGVNDCIFPLFTDFVTNHIVIRGMFEKVTLCVYGMPYTGTEGHLLLETAKNDVPLEKLQNRSEDFFAPEGEKIVLTNDDIQLLNNYTIESLISPYIKCEVFGGLKRAYYLTPPDVNMVEKTKTGYIYYENDLNYYSQCLFNFYLNENKKPLDTSETTFVSYFKKISEIIKILVSKNSVFLEESCILREENKEVFHKIPENLIEIIIQSLEGKYFGYTEIVYGLKLLKLMTNSSDLVDRFINLGGMEMLYGLILTTEKENNSFAGTSPVIRILVLDNIYRLITHAKAYRKFMDNIDKTKFQQQYFMVKEFTKDHGDVNESSLNTDNTSNIKTFSKKKEKKSEREKEKNRDRDRDKKKSKKEKKSKKDKKRNSMSKSKSRSPSRDNSELSYTKKHKDKKQAKNVLLKNGYQIILTLIIGKKSSLVNSMVKKIINKITFLMYLEELNEIVDFYDNLKNNNSTESNIYNHINDSEKISHVVQKILEYLYKTEVAYKKSYDKDEACGYSDEYSYRHFWVDYLKISRKFFKKSELFNIKSTLENDNNYSNKISDHKIITNEIAIILEENNFLENLLFIMVRIIFIFRQMRKSRRVEPILKMF